MRDLVDVHCPEATCIRVVQDNLSIHSAGALYEAFPPAEAQRILRRLEFHYTPKHASWLNMVEIEIGVLSSQCLDRRIDDATRLISEIAAWENQRNAAGRRIKWMFTTDKARAKMGRAYPQTPKSHNHCETVLVENAFALLVDDLLALLQRHFDRVIQPGKAVGADEFVLLDDTADLLRDDAAGLVLAVILVGRGRDRETLVFDLLGGFGRNRPARRATATKKTFQEGHRISLSICAASGPILTFASH